LRVLVVGAQSNLSIALCQELRKRSHEVFIIDLNPENAIADAAQTKVTAIKQAFDARDPSSCESVILDSIQGNSIDSLVYAAGYCSESSFISPNWESAMMHFQINTVGAAIALMSLGRYLRSQRLNGAAVIISSINARQAIPRYWAYCSSKAALERMIEIAAVDLAPNVRVNAVAPGVLEPVRGAKAVFPALNHRLRNRHLLDNKMTSALDVARVVCCLISEDCSWITGETISVDGGLRLMFKCTDPEF
jgi:NAD(P)-dependent dehydrogenase (short-subunit alcohol dehydrogenase family)